MKKVIGFTSEAQLTDPKVRKAVFEVEIRADGELSICGTIEWIGGGYNGGQCIEALAALLPNNPTAQRIAEVWQRWHLNHMRAACEHQRASGFLDRVGQEVTFYNWRMTSETLTASNAAEKNALKRLKAGETVTLEPMELRLMNLGYSRKTYTETLPEDLAPFYELAKGTSSYDQPREVKTLGWLNQSEHPDGLLGRPCEVCGYKYGSAWLKEELPPEIVAEVQSW